jgi:hypothetical protein
MSSDDYCSRDGGVMNAPDNDKLHDFTLDDVEELMSV